MSEGSTEKKWKRRAASQSQRGGKTRLATRIECTLSFSSAEWPTHIYMLYTELVERVERRKYLCEKHKVPSGVREKERDREKTVRGRKSEFVGLRTFLLVFLSAIFVGFTPNIVLVYYYSKRSSRW